MPKSHLLVVILSLAAVAILMIFRLAENVREKSPPPENSVEISVLQQDGTVADMDTELYVCHVVAAEMPVSFAGEALSAQAVAARTYALARTDEYGASRHAKADICGDSACCQAFCTTEQLQVRWGADYTKNWNKVCEAVKACRGQVLCYKDRLAETVFCSACGGRTESAADCWSHETPYLHSVACPWCTHAARYTGSQTYSLAEAGSLLGVDETSFATMRVEGMTSGGRVASLNVDGRTITGTDARRLLSLNSASFSWLMRDREIVFLSVGFGHGVGMCQYGADGMAADGADYAEILAYYYPGTELSTLY